MKVIVLRSILLFDVGNSTEKYSFYLMKVIVLRSILLFDEGNSTEKYPFF